MTNTLSPFALTMSGGGLSSLAYAGFVSVLHEHDIYPSVYAGLSGGAIAAVLLSSGLSVDKILEFVFYFTSIKMINTHLKHFEIIDHHRLVERMRNILPYKTFEELPIPVYIFASDLVNQKPVVLYTGDIASAIAGSCSFYPLLEPIKRRGSLLSDGGFTTYYGAQYLREKGMKKVIGVDVTGVCESTVGGILGLFYKQLNISLTSNKRYELSEYPVDLDIQIMFPAPFFLSIHQKADHIIKYGRKKAVSHISQIQKVIQKS